MFTLKKFLLITAAAAVVGIGAALVWTHYQAGNINEAAAQSVNTEAPDITVTAMDGTEVKLSSLRGKTVFVNFWATWCGPCMQEMPEMNKIYPDYKDKIEFFAVSLMIRAAITKNMQAKAALPTQCTGATKTPLLKPTAYRAYRPPTLLTSTAPLPNRISAA